MRTPAISRRIEACIRLTLGLAAWLWAVAPNSARAAAFQNTTAITIPASGPASVYPSSISVAGLSGEVLAVSVTFPRLTHPFPEDLDIVLMGPTGETVMLMSDAGGANPLTNVRLTFLDSSPVFLPDSGAIVAGSYHPSNYGTGDVFPTAAPPNPTPTAPFGNRFSVFSGDNPNGVWRLYVTDDSALNSGSLPSGWELELITTNRPPVITQQPQDQTVPAGSTATFQVVANGTPPFGYQWYRDGQVFIPFGQGGPTLTLANVSQAVAGDYRVAITNGANNLPGVPPVLSQIATLRVLTPLVIVEQPQSVNTQPGTTVTFSPVAQGTPPLQYQWTLNGMVLPDETNALLRLVDVQPSSGGSYALIIWNADEAVVSDPAVLVVRGATGPAATDKFVDRPVITADQGVLQGNSANAGRESGEAVAQGGGRTVWLEYLAPANGILTFNSRGSAFDSMLAVFTGATLPTLTPLTRDDDEGGFYTSKLQFNVAAGARYQIMLDGFSFAGLGGEYTLSWALERTTTRVPVIVNFPKPQAVVIGGQAVFQVVADSQDVSYQWFFNGKLIPGATQPVLTIAQARSGNVGFYSVRLVNSFGRVIFSPVVDLQIGSLGFSAFQDKYETMYSMSLTAGFYSIGWGNVFTNQAASAASHQSTDPTPCGGPFFGTLWQGLTATNTGVIQVDTSGSAVLTRLAVYKLSGGGSDLSTAPLICDLTSASNGLPAVVRFDASKGTNYTIVIEGFGGSGNLMVASKMGVAPPVSVTPQVCFVASGGSFVLKMPATNWCPLPVCQWFRNGLPITGATNSNLTLTGFGSGNEGTYSVVMSNFVATSSNVIAILSLAGPYALGSSWVTNSGNVGFKLAVSNTLPFVLETSTNLGGAWLPVATNPDPCLVLYFTNANALLDPQRFFRAAPWSPP